MTGEEDDLHQSLSITSPLSPCVLRATETTEAFCANSLIRKTLTSIVPLHFGGKNISLIFFFFSLSPPQQSKAGGALRGIRLCGGFSGDL